MGAPGVAHPGHRFLPARAQRWAPQPGRRQRERAALALLVVAAHLGLLAVLQPLLRLPPPPAGASGRPMQLRWVTAEEDAARPQAPDRLPPVAEAPRDAAPRARPAPARRPGVAEAARLPAVEPATAPPAPAGIGTGTGEATPPAAVNAPPADTAAAPPTPTPASSPDRIPLDLTLRPRSDRAPAEPTARAVRESIAPVDRGSGGTLAERMERAVGPATQVEENRGDGRRRFRFQGRCVDTAPTRAAAVDPFSVTSRTLQQAKACE